MKSYVWKIRKLNPSIYMFILERLFMTSPILWNKRCRTNLSSSWSSL